MESSSDVILTISVVDHSPDAASEAQQHLIDELNERGPIATDVQTRHQPGAKGDGVEIGQIALALLSAGIVKYAAQVIIEFIKRNRDYTIKLGDITIARHNASTKDIERIEALLHDIMIKRKRK